ncbi:MAG: serine hydrolase domain-containing protein [Rubricoccaceae bacterium]
MRALLLLFLLVGCASPETGDAADRSGTRGMDAALLAQARADADSLGRLHALLVARRGETLLAHRVRGPALDEPANVKSASKSVLSALVGIAIARGVLTGLDQPVAPLLGERLPPGADPLVRTLTVEHLLAMQAGLEPTSGANYGRFSVSDDWVRFTLTRPFEEPPGGGIRYSTGASHVLGVALARAAGRSLHALAAEWLGEPLGIAVPPWARDPQGDFFGGNDMLLSAEALLAFGEMYRRGGVAGRGRDAVRVLPEAWIRESWTPRGRSPSSGFRHGLGWWISEARGHPVYFAWGYGGQMVFVVPSLSLTVVMTSDWETTSAADGHLAALHRLLADRLIPAAERGAAPARRGRDPAPPAGALERPDPR